MEEEEILALIVTSAKGLSFVLLFVTVEDLGILAESTASGYSPGATGTGDAAIGAADPTGYLSYRCL